MIVVDASVVVHVLAVEPWEGPLHARLAAEDDLHAPHLLDLEVTSAVRSLVIRGRLADTDARACLADLRELPVVRYPHAFLLDRVWELRGNLTAYDATYVALAEALEAPLLTGDRALADAPGIRCPVEVTGY